MSMKSLREIASKELNESIKSEAERVMSRPDFFADLVGTMEDAGIDYAKKHGANVSDSDMRGVVDLAKARKVSEKIIAAYEKKNGKKESIGEAGGRVAKGAEEEILDCITFIENELENLEKQVKSKSDQAMMAWLKVKKRFNELASAAKTGAIG